MKRAWLHGGPTYFYLQINSQEGLLLDQKEPLCLGWSDLNLIADDWQEQHLQATLESWQALLHKYAVDSLNITLSPALRSVPLLPLLRLQFKTYGWPAPLFWSEADEVQVMLGSLTQATSYELVCLVCEHKLYLAVLREQHLAWHAALPLGLLDLYRKYCQTEPPEAAALIELRRQIVAYLDLIQFHPPRPQAVIVSEAVHLLVTANQPQQIQLTLSKDRIAACLPLLSKNYPRVACQQLNIKEPLGLLLLPTALIGEHLLDYLQLSTLEVLPLRLKLAT